VIVEIQLRRDDDKHYSWPAYVANLHARHCCPICLLVITVEQAISRWAEKTIELGPATAACRSIDEERSKLYLDLIDVSLKHSAPEALEVVMNSLGYEYQGDFARRYVAEGRAEGRTGTILRLLARRFGPMSETDQTLVRGAGDAVLDKVEDAMMKSATTLDEVLELLK